MDEKRSLGKRLRLSWVCIDVAPLMPLGFFLKFAISVKAHREVWDFAFRTWERLDFEGIHTITLNLCNNTKLIFLTFGMMYCLILTSVTLHSSTWVMHNFGALVGRECISLCYSWYWPLFRGKIVSRNPGSLISFGRRHTPMMSMKEDVEPDTTSKLSSLCAHFIGPVSNLSPSHLRVVLNCCRGEVPTSLYKLSTSAGSLLGLCWWGCAPGW